MTALRAHAAAVATHAMLGARATGAAHADVAGPAAAASGTSVAAAGTPAPGDADLEALGAAAGIDFKLAVSRGARNAATTSETGMDSLAVRLCEELVTLGPLARNRADPLSNTATHLTPQQFHQLLQRAAEAEAAEAEAQKAEKAEKAEAEKVEAEAVSSQLAEVGGGVVLLDARNVYETRIGHFEAGPTVPLLDPRTRCFSELPAWLDAHESALAGRTVLMYCTGGVRCERASAYLREKGPAFANVFQLSGGIQRYLEAFPDGGFFRGKNFLYDDRICVGPEAAPDAPAVGRCLLCGVGWDDYGERLRCSRCRLLLLVCDGCRAARHAATRAAASGPHHHRGGSTPRQHELPPPPPPPLLCELCSAGGGHQPNGSAEPMTSAAAAAATAAEAAGAAATGPSLTAAVGIPRQLGPGNGPGPGQAPERRLRILCLHGFRQSGKQFMGRTCSLRKKLRDLADCVFLDAPHTLPHFIKYDRVRSCRAGAAAVATASVAEEEEEEEEAAETAGPGDEAELEAGHGHGISPPASPGAAPALPVLGLVSPGRGVPVLPPGAARRAWLVSPQLLSLSHSNGHSNGSVDGGGDGDGAGGAAGWSAAPSFVDEQQHTQQAEGWAESLAELRRAVGEQGPFDGVFGFSQGAAVAAVLCALQQQHRERQQQPQPQPCSRGASGDGGGDTSSNNEFGFRFAILGSGFPSPAPEHVALLEQVGPIRLPSLHVYGLAPQPPQPPQSPQSPSAAAAAAGATAGAAVAAAAGATAAADVAADAGDDRAASTASAANGCGGGSAGDGGAGDRQIGEAASEALAAAFAPQQRRCLRHTAGHLIPATKPHAAAFRSFLSQFL